MTLRGQQTKSRLAMASLAASTFVMPPPGLIGDRLQPVQDDARLPPKPHDHPPITRSMIASSPGICLSSISIAEPCAQDQAEGDRIGIAAMLAAAARAFSLRKAIAPSSCDNAMESMSGLAKISRNSAGLASAKRDIGGARRREARLAAPRPRRRFVLHVRQAPQPPPRQRGHQRLLVRKVPIERRRAHSHGTGDSRGARDRRRCASRAISARLRAPPHADRRD